MIRPFPTLDPEDRLPHWFDATDFSTDEGSPVDTLELAIDENPDGALSLVQVAQNGAWLSFYPINPTADVTYTIRCRCTLLNGAKADLSRTVTGEQH
jgi:hypothetical protein